MIPIALLLELTGALHLDSNQPLQLLDNTKSVHNFRVAKMHEFFGIFLTFFRFFLP